MSTRVNVPVGAAAAGPVPQHAIVPSVRRAHACAAPTSTSTNDPAGGVIGPLGSPQRRSVASAWTAQATFGPAPTARKPPPGGSSPGWPSPQQTIPPSPVVTPHV